MKHWPFWASLLLLGCPGGGGTVDAGPDGNDIPPEDLRITVSGTAHIHPVAASWLQSQGRPVPSLEGLTLRIEEPLKVATNDPLGIFGTVTLSDAGTFSVSNVRVELVNLGIAAGIKDDAADGGTPRVIRAASAIYDVALEGRKPDRDISGAKAYAVPTEFHDQLTRAVTEQRIRSITAGNEQTTLIGAGFMLGRIVDDKGNPVSGAKVLANNSAAQDRIFYPTADFSSVTQNATAEHGLFLYVHNAGSVLTFKFSIDGRPEYLQRNAGAAKDACLVTTVYPGKTPPP